MSSRRSSSHNQQPAQRRPRAEKACRSCRRAKQRCVPAKYGTYDRTCRRCEDRGLDCDIPLPACSQSPSSGPSSQHGPGPIRHNAPSSAGGPGSELAPGSHTDVQCPVQQPGSFPMEGWSRLMMYPEGRQDSGTTILTPGQTSLGTSNLSPVAPTMEACYQQSFPNVAQGRPDQESSYYPQTISYSDGGPNFGYDVEEPQSGNDDTSASEQDASFFPLV